MAKKKAPAKKVYRPPPERTWQIIYRDAPATTMPSSHVAHEVSIYGGAIEFTRRITEDVWVTSLILPSDILLRVELVVEDTEATT